MPVAKNESIEGWIESKSPDERKWMFSRFEPLPIREAALAAGPESMKFWVKATGTRGCQVVLKV